MTASEHAKAAGLKSLLDVSKLTGVSTQTLNNWHRNKITLFKIVIEGCKSMKENPLKINAVKEPVLEVGQKIIIPIEDGGTGLEYEAVYMSNGTESTD